MFVYTNLGKNQSESSKARIFSVVILSRFFSFFFCFSGRHWTNVTFVVLSGSIKYWEEGRLRAIEYKPGDSFTHYSGTTGSLSWGANTWVLEYGRGFVPMSFPSTLADMTFTSFDVIGIFKMCRGFAVAMYYELKNEIVSFISSI